MYDWDEIQRLRSTTAYEMYRARTLCCSVSYVKDTFETCTVYSGDHKMTERRLYCSSVTCSPSRRCPVEWKARQCSASEAWVVLVNEKAHGRRSLPCLGKHKPVLSTAMKDFIAEEDENDATPRLIETRLKKKPTLEPSPAGWPTLAQIANALKRIREGFGTRNTIEGIEDFITKRVFTADTHKQPDKAFIFGPMLDAAGLPYVGSGNDDDPFILGCTSIEKINAAVDYATVGRFTVFHADATFKLSDFAYPVITCGFTDSARAYQLVALFVVSQRTSRDFRLCFQVIASLARRLCRKVLDVNAFMGDADDAQVNGLHCVEEFATTTPLMCYFHVLYNVRNKTTHLSPALRKIIITSINDMHFSLSIEEFLCVQREGLQRWNTYPELKVFGEYFRRLWLTGRFWRWQVFHTPAGYAAINNPCEVFNASIKSYTRRRRYHMTKLLGKMCDLVESHKNVEPVGDDYCPKPTADVIEAAVKMVKSGRTTLVRLGGGTQALVLYRQASAAEDTTSSDIAFAATFGKGTDVGKKVAAS